MYNIPYNLKRSKYITFHNLICREKTSSKIWYFKLFNRKIFCLKHFWIYNSEMYMMYVRYIVWPIKQSASLFSVVNGQLMTRWWTKNNASLGDYFTANIPQHLIKRCLNWRAWIHAFRASAISFRKFHLLRQLVSSSSFYFVSPLESWW